MDSKLSMKSRLIAQRLAQFEDNSRSAAVARKPEREA